MEERLKKFVAVVEAGSYTLAAQLLHTSQPGLSQAVKKLERELKTKLLVTRGRGFDVTPAGKIAFQYGKHLLRENKQFFRDIMNSANKKPLLRIGAIDSIADTLFVRHDLLDILKKTADVTLQVNNTKNLLMQLYEGDCDIVLVVAQHNYASDFAAYSLGHEELLFVCAPTLYATSTEGLQLGILNNYMSYNTASNTYKMVDEYLRANNVIAVPIFNSTSPELLLRLTLAGKGTAVLPAQTVDPYINKGALVALRVGDTSVHRQLVAVHAKDSVRKDFVEIISLAKEVLVKP